MKLKFFIALFFSTYLFSITIEDTIKDVIKTNPLVKERIKYFKSVAKDVKIAKSGYKPKLDLVGSYGRERTNNSSTYYQDVDLTKRELALIFSQNLFEGFGTKNNIQKQKHRVNSALYSIVEEMNKVSLDMAEAYINLFKQKALVDIARENLETHQRINKKIQERMDSGVGTTSELQQSISRLALANSNLLTERNNFEDVKSKFIKIYGKELQFDLLVEPKKIDLEIPQDIDKLIKKAKLNDPSLKVQKENINVTSFNHKLSQKSFYPKIDFEIRSEWNNNVGGVEGKNDRTSVMLKFQYNLFNGEADIANKEKMLEDKLREQDSLQNLNRRVEESIRLSWMAYQTLRKQIPFLEKYKEMSQKTLTSYLEEFDLGRRTLLDILDTEEELYSAKRQLITAKYDLIFSEYRILESLGKISFYVDKSLEKFVEKNSIK